MVDELHELLEVAILGRLGSLNDDRRADPVRKGATAARFPVGKDLQFGLGETVARFSRQTAAKVGGGRANDQVRHPRFHRFTACLLPAPVGGPLRPGRPEIETLSNNVDDTA